jgi:hypothetical protein
VKMKGIYWVLPSLLLSLLWVVGCTEPDSGKVAPQAEVPPAITLQNKPNQSPPQLKPQPLDLSIDKLSLSTVEGDTDVDFSAREHSLSGVFEKTKKEKKTSVSAGVLTEEENKDYLDSINGAEVSVEMKIP